MTNLPISGAFQVTATFGQKGPYWSGGHKGIDLVSKNLEIFSTCDGVVRVVSYDPAGWGHYVSVGDNEGQIHLFCHLKAGSIKVVAGQKVNRSTVLGTMGTTGHSTGVHLHYQINDSLGVPKDPSRHLGIPNKKGYYNSKDYQLKEVTTLDKIKTTYADDDQIPSWAKAAVAECKDEGILFGKDGNNFCPNEPLTRAEAACIAQRLMHHKA